MKRRAGFVAILGRPNVGKSTLLNSILGKKVTITSRKPQTTRHRILGIKTTDQTQVAYIDTPGLHQQNAKHHMNRVMNQSARSALAGVDVVLFMVQAMQWTEEDAAVLALLKKVELPVILVVNKVDQIKNKQELLPFIDNLAKQLDFKKILPVSAKTGLQLNVLESEITTFLSHDGELFSPTQLTDCSDQFVCTEFVREKLTRSLSDELPYELTVTIEAFEETSKIVRVAAVIWVAKEGQKAIVIGKAGLGLKKVGIYARQDLEDYFGKKVLLKLWVKVKENWSDDLNALKTFGYQ